VVDPRADGSSHARIENIEGQRVLVVDRVPPLPRSLDLLISSMLVVERADVRPTGASVACEQLREHRFTLLRRGRHVGLDGVVRDLRIEMCRDCGAAKVLDVSRDVLPGLRVGARGAARREVVLGWYTGQRRGAREYR